ncbi:hypothetical protein V8C43DRAFT_328452 [Trichoderma afarasin]|uniref:Uncharacterized protein n=1 Tax=Trichoderma lentiforme TaxID=1567552 RepID=A0A9P4X4W7_9HYPO|nr:hypothetical protein CFAM422_012333 [Trichoderma lentiforme]
MRVSIISTLTMLGLSALAIAAPSPVDNLEARAGRGRCQCQTICHTVPGGMGAGGTWCDCTYNGSISGCTKDNSCDSNCDPLQ